MEKKDNLEIFKASDVFTNPKSLLSILVFIILAAGSTLELKGQEPLPFPSGMRDPVSPIAYIRTESTVAAIHLTDGTTIWDYPVPGKPIATIDGQLVVQVALRDQAFRIDLIDRTTGALLVRSEPIFFYSRPVSDFLASPAVLTKIQGRDVVLLTWRIRPHYSGGANPPPDIGKSALESIVTARFSVATGKIQVENIQDTSKVTIAENTKNPEALEGILYNRNGQLTDAPWTLDNSILQFVRGPSSRDLILEVHMSNSAQIRSTALTYDSSICPPFVTDDGRYVIVPTKRDTWTVYTASNGVQIGAFSAPSLEEPCVVGDHLYYRTDQASNSDASKKVSVLIGIDLSTRKILWTKPLAVIHQESRPKLPM